MMNLIQRFFSKDNKNRSELRNNFKKYFFSLPEHQWLLGTEGEGHFLRLIELLPSRLLEVLMTSCPLSFVRSEDLKGSSPGRILSNAVVVFPEFQKLLLTSKKSAVAYLAHEMAFVLYEMESDRKDPLMAEIEADKFVCDLGLTFELEELLLMLDETIEKRLRLTYLTVNHFTSQDS
jgi:hypothetical protein